MGATSHALFREHALLGARMAGDGRAVPVLSYAGAEGGKTATEGAWLADLSGMAVLRLAGPVATPFARTACAVRPLAVGECAPSAVLAGDGAVVGIPLLARTGEGEHVVMDATGRAETVMAWLGFLASVERDGHAPYAGLVREDATDVHVPLVLFGSHAPTVLADYVSDRHELPAAGAVAPLVLDGRIECLALGIPSAGPPCYLLLVSPTLAPVVWRSLLSFPVVTPVGRDALLPALRPALPWLARADGPGRVIMGADELVALGLARPEATFVGARALVTGEGGRP